MFKLIINLISIILLIFSYPVFAQNSGLKEIVKSQQDKINSVEKTLKKLIGKIENETSNSSDLKNILNKINSIDDNLNLLESKIQTLNQFAYKLEFEINRLQSHLNLSSSISNKSKSKNISPTKPDLQQQKAKVSKEGLSSKTAGVLGYISEENKTKQTKPLNDKQANKILPTTDPEKQYKFALNYALKGDYDKAEFAFKEFLKKNKKHKRTQDAQYWLGRVYFTKKRYEEAAIALAEYNSLYPDDKRFQETTLLIAESASNFAPKDQLCEILTQSLDFMEKPTPNFVKRINKMKIENKCPGE